MDAPPLHRKSMLSETELAAQPLDRAVALPAHCYTDPALFAFERGAIFARAWQLVARSADLAASGDHTVAEIAGVPLLIVRGADGELRALHNVCRHRAGPIATCDGRGARRLVCRYHGWSYDLDGRLLSASDMDDAAGFDASKISLPQARIAQWQGLVFAALGEAPPLEDVVAGIDQRIGSDAFADLAFERSVTYDIACNWKTYVDNFLEGYHLPLVHPELNRLLDYRRYATETAIWSSLQSSPIDGSSGPYASGEALYYFLWPNIMLNILPGRLQVNRVVPLETQRCRVEFDYFHAPGGNAGAVAAPDEDEAFSDLVQRQDIAICERVQRGLASGSYVAGRLNPRHERGLHHFQELVRSAYRTQLDAH